MNTANIKFHEGFDLDMCTPEQWRGILRIAARENVTLLEVWPDPYADEVGYKLIGATLNWGNGKGISGGIDKYGGMNT